MSTPDEIEFIVAQQAIQDAQHPEDIFGKGDAVTSEFRRLAALVHPDRYAGKKAPIQSALAEQAFKRLGYFKAAADHKLAHGTYGDRTASQAPPPPFQPLTVVFRGQSYTADTVLCDGDVCTLYHAGDNVLKVARVPAHNDLVENEATVLTALVPADQRACDKDFYRYLPALRASFSVRGASGPRRVNVLQHYVDCPSLTAVRRAFPAGLDFRDAAWMLRRILEGLSFVHDHGLVHGAILPPHVLIQPPDHGARLIDWSYAVRCGERVRAISAAHRAFYPPEVLSKQPATPATDLYMWARCGDALINDDPAANPVRRFLASCWLANPARRPQSAFDLHKEFSDLLKTLVGKPKFRPFKMPASS